MKDRDSFVCECGEVLESWNSIWVPSYSRIDEDKDPGSAS